MNIALDQWHPWQPRFCCSCEGADHKRSDCCCCSVARVIWTVEPIWCIKHHKYCPGPFPKEETDDDGAQGRALSWYYRVRERRKKKRVVQWASTFVVVNQKNHFLFFSAHCLQKGPSINDVVSEFVVFIPSLGVFLENCVVQCGIVFVAVNQIIFSF